MSKSLKIKTQAIWDVRKHANLKGWLDYTESLRVWRLELRELINTGSSLILSDFANARHHVGRLADGPDWGPTEEVMSNDQLGEAEEGWAGTKAAQALLNKTLPQLDREVALLQESPTSRTCSSDASRAPNGSPGTNHPSLPTVPASPKESDWT